MGLFLHRQFKRDWKHRDAYTEGKDLLTAASDVAQLTKPLMLKLLARWEKEPGLRPGTKLSNSSINKRLIMANVLLDIAGLPKHGVECLSVMNSRRMRRVADNEIQAMVSWCMANHHRKGATSMADMIQVGVQCAARLSEMLNLRWVDVDFNHGTMALRTTKNGDARFGIITDLASRILERRRTYGGDGPFSDLSKGQAEALWADGRKALGLAEDKDFVFHVATRHECLSRLGDDDTNTFQIKAYGGHKSTATSDRYVHVSTQRLRQLGNRVLSTQGNDLRDGKDARMQ